MALRNQSPGSFVMSTRDPEYACVIHWIKPDKMVDSVKFVETEGGFKRKGSKKVYKTMKAFIEDKKEHFSNPVGDIIEPEPKLQADEPVDLETQLSRLTFYVGYKEGGPCNIILSNQPPGTYLLRRKNEDKRLRISFVTMKRGQVCYLQRWCAPNPYIKDTKNC